MTRVRCLGCHVEAIVDSVERTAAATLVRISCGTCRKPTTATLLDDPATGEAIDLEAEARRIFADDLPAAAPIRHDEPVRPMAPDPPTLDEIGLAPPEPEPADRVQAAYEAWMKTPDGRSVAKAIRDRALELRRRGWSSYGIQAIAEVVRFDHALRVGPDAAGYRVNNSHLSRLARDLMAHYSELDGFFEVRELHARPA